MTSFVQARSQRRIGTFTLHCYAYANACVRAVTRRACTASIVLEWLGPVHVTRSSRFSSPLYPFPRPINPSKGKFVFPKRSFLCLRLADVRLTTYWRWFLTLSRILLAPRCQRLRGNYEEILASYSNFYAFKVNRRADNSCFLFPLIDTSLFSRLSFALNQAPSSDFQ